jgi:hypothetical protein
MGVVTTAVCDDAWHIEMHRQDGQVMHAVSSRWIQGAWAVGSVADAALGVQRTYIEHWNGTDWKHIDSPNLDSRAAPGDNELFGVVGIGADIWAVGGSADPGDATHASGHFALAMHNDGTGWRLTPTDPATGRATLLDVWQASTHDVWAVGQSWHGSHPVAERWDGAAWHDVPVPDPTPAADGFRSVSGAGPDDIWAVGTSAGGARTLAEHWNGRTWAVVTMPDPEADHVILQDVSVRRDGYAISVGALDPLGTVTNRTLIERWRDGVWRTRHSPNPGADRDVLLGVDRGPHALQKFWAVGWRRATPTGASEALILRLLDGRWRVDPAPDPYPGGWSRLEDVAVFGRDTFDAVGAVAVGSANDPATGASRAVIMRRCAP